MIGQNKSFTLSTLLDEAICYGVDCRNSVLDEGKVATLQAKDGGGYSLNCTHPVLYAVYDARGNGDGETVPTLTGDHQNRITDYTALAVYTPGRYAEYTENLPILRASGGDCGGGSEGIVVYEAEV